MDRHVRGAYWERGPWQKYCYATDRGRVSERPHRKVKKKLKLRESTDNRGFSIIHDVLFRPPPQHFFAVACIYDVHLRMRVDITRFFSNIFIILLFIFYGGVFFSCNIRDRVKNVILKKNSLNTRLAHTSVRLRVAVALGVRTAKRELYSSLLASPFAADIVALYCCGRIPTKT